MSPARSHIEQSRNTLLFASCAKKVVTNAQVNVVMSDKALVKHLQRELARLENELKHVGFNTCGDRSDVLKDKDAQIKKVVCVIFFFMLLMHVEFSPKASFCRLLVRLDGDRNQGSDAAKRPCSISTQ